MVAILDGAALSIVGSALHMKMALVDSMSPSLVPVRVAGRNTKSAEDTFLFMTSEFIVIYMTMIDHHVTATSAEHVVLKTRKPRIVLGSPIAGSHWKQTTLQYPLEKQSD
jgi:hypothetical protein